MDKENVVYIHNGVLGYSEEQNYIICRKIDETRDYPIKRKKSDSERQVLHIFYPVWNLGKKKDM
jgi:hypothetical protein